MLIFRGVVIANRVEMEVGVVFVPVKKPRYHRFLFRITRVSCFFALMIEESGIFPSRSRYIENIEKILKWNVWKHEVGYNHWKWQTCHPLCPYQLSITVSYLESLQNPFEERCFVCSVVFLFKSRGEPLTRFRWFQAQIAVVSTATRVELIEKEVRWNMISFP